MSAKQDRQGVRTASELERKYGFGKTFAEILGIAEDAQDAAEEAKKNVTELDENLTQDEIFNRLTNNGEAKGVYRDDEGNIYINADYIQSGSINADLITTGTLSADYMKLYGSNRLYNFANLSELSTFVENIVSNMSINTQTVIGVGLNFSPFQCFGTATITVGFDGNGVKNAIVVLISNARSWHRKGSLKNGNMVWEDWQTGFLELTSNPASPYYIRMSVTDSIASLSLMYGASRAGMQVAPDSSTSSGIIGKMYADKVTVYHAPTATTDATNKEYVDSNFAPSGYGLGAPYSQAGSLAELDSYKRPGWYRFAGTKYIDDVWALTNPFMRVDTWDANLCMQTIYSANLPFREAQRICSGGTWQPWEFVNPPLVAGYECRTTERFNDSVVYTKLLSFSPSSFSAQAVSLPHGISSLSQGISIHVSWVMNSTQRRHFPSVYFGDNAAWGGQVFWEGTDKITFELGSSLQSHMSHSVKNILVTLKYIK